jgi:hypothetical protein
MFKVMFLLIFSLPAIASIERHKMLIENCLKSQKEFGYQKILERLDSEAFTWNADITHYDENKTITVSLRKSGTPIIGGLYCLCHMYEGKTASAHFEDGEDGEDGEFGIYGKSKKLFFEYPKFDISNIGKNELVISYVYSSNLMEKIDGK